MIRYNFLPVFCLVICLSVIAYDSKEAQAASDCSFSDLKITVDIPEGYEHARTECPKVAYTRLLDKHHAMGFYVVETPYPYNSASEKSLSETLDDYILILWVQHDKSQAFFEKVDNKDLKDDFPEDLVNRGGVCRGWSAKVPRRGVEWRKGISCLVEFPPSSDQWIMFQATFFDWHTKQRDYMPKDEFDRAARKLFRSMRIREEALSSPDNG